MCFPLQLLPALTVAGQTYSLVCEFEGGVGLNGKGEIFNPAKVTERFSFRVPVRWFSKNAQQDTETITWTNLVHGWDGGGVGSLTGEMINIIESHDSDNGLYFAIWPNHKNNKGQIQSIMVNVGHNALPKEYEASKLRNGFCEIK
jgi:hypothetical protein